MSQFDILINWSYLVVCRLSELRTRSFIRPSALNYWSISCWSVCVCVFNLFYSSARGRVSMGFRKPLLNFSVASKAQANVTANMLLLICWACSGYNIKSSYMHQFTLAITMADLWGSVQPLPTPMWCRLRYFKIVT